MNIRALLLMPLIAFVGCTLIPTQHGVVQFWGDYTDIKFEDGTVKFEAKSMIHSRVARVHWNGAATVGQEIVSGVIGMNGTPVVGAAASVISPIVNRTTSRPDQETLFHQGQVIRPIRP